MPLPFLVLDFETYYDRAYSLRRLTVPEYVHDPRFRAHGIAVRHPDGRAAFHWDTTTAIRELQGEYGAAFERAIVVVHNALFDLYILARKFGVRPARFLDTLALAHHVHGRKGAGGGESASLKALAERYGLQAKGELDFMCGVIEPDPRQRANLERYALDDVEITCQLAQKLLPKITQPEVELPLIMHTTRLFTERGVHVDLNALAVLRAEILADCERWFRDAGADPKTLASNAQFANLLMRALQRTGRLVPLKPGKNGLIPAIAKKDTAMQALAEDDDPVVATLVQARLGKRSADQLLARLDTMVRIANATRGALPVHLVYYGAHTGRFAGGGKFNIQNLGRTGHGERIRGLIRPANGSLFVVGDLAQIEARVLAWLAGQTDLVAAFREGQDIYSQFASGVFGREVRKPRKDDAPEHASRLKADRQIGKQAMLGLGYSMGALRFMNTLRADPLAAPLFDLGVLTPLICRDIVHRYRETYSEIPALWNRLEDAFREALNGCTLSLNGLALQRADESVLVWLPNGRALRYPNARLEEAQRSIHFLDANGEEAEFTPEGASIVYGRDKGLYGGKLTENVVQAIARDVLAEAILGLEQMGYPVMFHVHDEVVVEVPAERAEAAITAVKQMLEGPRPWAPGLPLLAEVDSCDRYAK